MKFKISNCGWCCVELLLRGVGMLEKIVAWVVGKNNLNL